MPAASWILGLAVGRQAVWGWAFVGAGMTPILDTPRLQLRPLALGDVDALFAIMSDPETMRYWDWPPFTERETVHDIIAGQISGAEARNSRYWSACLKATGAMIGTCDLSDIEHHHRRAEVGFAFNRAYWGNGYALEAMASVLRYALGELGLKRLGARLHAENDASRRLLERLGFSSEGRLEHYVLRDGVWRDCLIYGLVRGR